jgi:hypothetical protein
LKAGRPYSEVPSLFAGLIRCGENKSHAKAEAVSSGQNINWITNSLWGIADDIRRDLYACGKYRDVILGLGQ